MLNNHTGKYARTLNEAFPKTMEYGASIEIHCVRLSIADLCIRVIALLGLIVVALDCLVWRP
jgi:hypothetical protein